MRGHRVLCIDTRLVRPNPRRASLASVCRTTYLTSVDEWDRWWGTPSLDISGDKFFEYVNFLGDRRVCTPQKRLFVESAVLAFNLTSRTDVADVLAAIQAFGDACGSSVRKLVIVLDAENSIDIPACPFLYAFEGLKTLEIKLDDASNPDMAFQGIDIPAAIPLESLTLPGWVSHPSSVPPVALPGWVSPPFSLPPSLTRIEADIMVGAERWLDYGEFVSCFFNTWPQCAIAI